MTTWRSPNRWHASARRSGSSRATSSGRPRLTAQKPQGRVQTSPRIMNVAVRRVQHSERLGQRALSQTVSRPSSLDQAARERHPSRGGDRPLEPLGQAGAAADTLDGGRTGSRLQRATCSARQGPGRLGNPGRSPGAGSVDMGKDLPANQRVSGVDVVPFQAEDLFQRSDQGLTHLGHRRMPLPPGLHRGISQGQLADSRLVQARQRVRGTARR